MWERCTPEHRRGAIRGQVIGPGGDPISAATVMIVSGPCHQDIDALTEDLGCFRLTSLLPGRYGVSICSADYHPHP
jgi:Carboxypeptidase regulatory-like domain